MQEYVKLKDVSKIYNAGENSFYALNNVTVSFEQGEIITILGPSGSGKSTLLNMIGGIDVVSKGQIIVNNEIISEYNKSQLCEFRKDNIGFIFQFYNLIPNLNVYENIELVKDICTNVLDIDKLLEILGIGNLKFKYPSELSGGQQQRVAIARALIKNPPLLLCDEPTGALDTSSSKEILKILKDINEQYNTTIIIITHNEEIANITNRTIRICDGRIFSNEINTNIISVEEMKW